VSMLLAVLRFHVNDDWPLARPYMAIVRWCTEELGLFESGGKKFKVSFIQNDGGASNGKLS
jgi:hypothetical protein